MMFAASDRVKTRGVPLPREAPWPRPSPLPQNDAAIELPIPAESVFQIREGLRLVMQVGGPTGRRAELTVPAHDETVASRPGNSRRTIRGRRSAGQPTRHAARARHGTLKQLVQVKRGNV
jgi:hypothetical protein